MAKAGKISFLSLAFIIYAAFLTIDIFYPNIWGLSDRIKYAGMLLCFAYILPAIRRPISKYDRKYALIAFLFTLAADTVLLLFSNNTLGIYIFCLAHIFYLKRYKSRLFAPAFVILGCASALYFLSPIFKIKLPFLHIISFIYALLIASVCVSVFRSDIPKPNKGALSAAMVLFFLCDVNVMLYNILPYGKYSSLAFILMWFFYYPSQVLIALASSRPILFEKE